MPFLPCMLLRMHGNRNTTLFTTLFNPGDLEIWQMTLKRKQHVSSYWVILFVYMNFMTFELIVYEIFPREIHRPRQADKGVNKVACCNYKQLPSLLCLLYFRFHEYWHIFVFVNESVIVVCSHSSIMAIRRMLINQDNGPILSNYSGVIKIYQA